MNITRITFACLLIFLFHNSLSLSMEIYIDKWLDGERPLFSEEANQIISLVCNYYAASETGGPQAISKTMHFEDEKQKERYLSKSNLLKMAWNSPGTENQVIYFIPEANSAPLEEYIFLFQHSAGRYFVQVVETIVVDGQLKLKCPYSAEELLLSPSERHIAQAKKELAAWKESKDDELTEKVRDFKRSWHDQIKALEYAQKHSIELFTPINGTLEEIVAMHDKIDDLTEIELRNEMIESYEKEIEQDNQRKQRAALSENSNVN